MPKRIIISLLILFSSTAGGLADAKPQVVTSTATLAAIVKALGGDRVDVESIARGTQDPHYLEAKPSYMVLVRKADLFVAVGLQLESAWLGNVLRGSRNPKIQIGQPGLIELGMFIEPIEVPRGRIDRTMGDVHGAGNPHFYLDPVRVVKVAEALTDRLVALDGEGKSTFETNLKTFSENLNANLPAWKERVQQSGIERVFTYHRTLNYFLSRFDITFAGSIEPKPGIPPTAQHIVNTIRKIKRENIACILVENFFEMKPARRIQQSTSVHVEEVATEVRGMPSIDTYTKLIDHLVGAIEACGRGRK